MLFAANMMFPAMALGMLVEAPVVVILLGLTLYSLVSFEPQSSWSSWVYANETALTVGLGLRNLEGE